MSHVATAWLLLVQIAASSTVQGYASIHKSIGMLECHVLADADLRRDVLGMHSRSCAGVLQAEMSEDDKERLTLVTEAQELDVDALDADEAEEEFAEDDAEALTQVGRWDTCGWLQD